MKKIKKIKKMLKDEKKFTALLAVFAVLLGVVLALIFPIDIFNFNSSNIPREDFGNSNQGKLSNIFDSSSSWSTNEGWEGVGVSVHGGEIIDGKFTIKEGKYFAHYGKRFMNQSFDKVSVVMDLPEGYSEECSLNLATGTESQKDAIVHFNFGETDFKDKKKYSLKDGENVFDISDIESGKFSYLKVTLFTDNSTQEKPYIKNVSIE